MAVPQRLSSKVRANLLIGGFAGTFGVIVGLIYLYPVYFNTQHYKDVRKYVNERLPPEKRIG